MSLAPLATSDPKTLGLDEAALARLDASIQGDIDGGLAYGGTLLVARGGQIAHRKTFGTVAPGRPAADDDRYLLMSMSKAYLATLILKGIEEGRYTLETKVDELVPGFGVAGKQRATLRQLMTHTAGLPFGLIPPGVPLDKIGDLAAKAKAINAVSALYAPGTRCSYTSAMGYDLLGQVLVNADPQGRGYRQILAEDLFAPLGMDSSSIGIPVDDPRRVPVSATEKSSGPNMPLLVQAGNVAFTGDNEFPAGNAFSSIDDIFRFTEVFRGRGTSGDNRVLSPALFDYAARNHTGDLINEAWLFETESRGLEPFKANFSLLGGYVRGNEHNFTAAGYTASPGTVCAVGGGSTSFIIDPVRDLTVIFLSAGFFEGLLHLERVCRINDLALATVNS